MQKIAILCPSTKPVPAVRGGAVETIIEGLITQNEKTPKFEITVFSEYEKEAEIKSKKFKNTTFVYVRTNIKIERIYYLFYRFVKKIFKIALPDNLARNKMVKEIMVNDYDWILFEAGEVFSLKYYKNKLPKEKLLVHAHGMITPIPDVDQYFSYYISISEFVQRYWKKSSNRPSNTYKIWKNCIYTEKFQRKLEKDKSILLRKRLGFSKNDYIIIFTGRIIPEKGVLELINALNFINDDSIKLLIIGSANFADKTSSTYEKKVYNQVQKFGSRVKFTGYISNEELYKYYSIASVAVVPSMWDEPAGLVVVEAMAAGVPLITTGSGGIQEYVNENAALFVERNDSISSAIAQAIIKIKNSPELAQRLRKNGYKVAEEYDMENYLLRFEEIIHEISI